MHLNWWVNTSKAEGSLSELFSFTIQAAAISFLKVTHQTYPKWSKSHMYLWDLLHLYLFRTDFVFLCNIFQLPHLNYLRGDTLNQILLDLLLSSRPQQWSTFQCDGLIDIFSGHHRLRWFFNGFKTVGPSPLNVSGGPNQWFQCFLKFWGQWSTMVWMSHWT